MHHSAERGVIISLSRLAAGLTRILRAVRGSVFRETGTFLSSRVGRTAAVSRVGRGFGRGLKFVGTV